MAVVDSSAMIRALTDDRELGDQARAALSMHERRAAPARLTADARIEAAGAAHCGITTIRPGD